MERNLPVSALVVDVVRDLPDIVLYAVATGSDLVLAVFGIALVAEWARARTRPAGTFALTMLAGLAPVVAYGISRMVKLHTKVLRPCQQWELVLVTGCPAPGDWSFTSNHAAIVAALAVGWWRVRYQRAFSRSVTLTAVLLALGAAASRVVLGVHAVVDVAAGLALGAVVAVVLLACSAPLGTLLKQGRRAERGRRQS